MNRGITKYDIDTMVGNLDDDQGFMYVIQDGYISFAMRNLRVFIMQ